MTKASEGICALAYLGVLSGLLACSSDVAVLRAKAVRTQVLLNTEVRASGVDGLQRWQAADAAGLLDGFDGTVVDLGFERSAYVPQPLEPSSYVTAINLARRGAARMKHNLQALSLAPSQPRWSDDAFFLQASANFETAAALVAQADMRGVFIDNQMYGPSGFAVSTDESLGFSELEALARQRGAQLTSALLRGFPGLTIMLAWGYSEMFREICITGKPLASHPYALYPAFLDGMRDAMKAAGASAILVDGYLPSYPARTRSHFDVFAALVAADEKALAGHWVPNIVTHWDDAGDRRGPVLWPPAYARLCDAQTAQRLLVPLPSAFGLMLDYTIDGHSTQLDPSVPRQDYSAENLRAALGKALRTSETYVWLYLGDSSWWDTDPALPSVPEPARRSVVQARQDVAEDPVGLPVVSPP